MVRVTGDNCYFLLALADYVAVRNIVRSVDATEHLKKQGFDEDYIRDKFKKYDIRETINNVDVDIIVNNIVDDPSIVVTYPAYDNRGMPSKLGQCNIISSLVKELLRMISLATKEIVIISPYIEEDGIVYFEEVLKHKASRGVSIKILVREFDENSIRKEKIIRWIKTSFEDFTNVKLYNYHYISDSRHIESTCHAKIIVVDGITAYVGSADIRQRAFELNFEIGSIHSGYVAKKISDVSHEMISVSEEIKMW